jgi:hypothetical protein
MRIRADLLRLQDSTAQIRVRGAMVLLVVRGLPALLYRGLLGGRGTASANPFAAEEPELRLALCTQDCGATGPASRPSPMATTC